MFQDNHCREHNLNKSVPCWLMDMTLACLDLGSLIENRHMEENEFKIVVLFN